MYPFILVKIFFRPLVLWLAAIAFYVYLKIYVVGSLSESMYLVGLPEALESKAVWVAAIPFALGLFSLIHRLQLLYSWHSDASLGCDHCGGPQDKKTGRYGQYRKCLHCGATKSGWQ